MAGLWPALCKELNVNDETTSQNDDCRSLVEKSSYVGPNSISETILGISKIEIGENNLEFVTTAAEDISCNGNQISSRNHAQSLSQDTNIQSPATLKDIPNNHDDRRTDAYNSTIGSNSELECNLKSSGEPLSSAKLTLPSISPCPFTFLFDAQVSRLCSGLVYLIIVS